MAPFKLRFRMGGSRSTSQEADAEPPQQPLLNNITLAINGSNTTIDSEHNTDSYGSLNNDQRALIQNNSTGEQIGYTNPNLIQNFSEINNTIPLSPPPSYEHVLEENRLAALDKDNNPTTTLTATILQHQPNQNQNINILNENSSYNNRQESIDSHVFSYSTMTTPSQENLLECTGSCDPLYDTRSEEHAEMSQCIGESNVHHDDEQCSSNTDEENNSEHEWNINENPASEQHHQNQQHHQQQQQQMQHHQTQELGTPEYIDNKSSKEMYKAAAKQWGITCKMSEQCRCMDCQSHYFDCEFDDNDHQKSDGGLGAGTPVFISEVMNGSACNIL